METTYQLTLNIRRFDPETGRSWVQRYSLEAGRILRFVDLLRKINDEQDPTLDLELILRARPVRHLFGEGQRQTAAGL